MAPNSAGLIDGVSSMVPLITCVLVILGGGVATMPVSEVSASDSGSGDAPVIDPAHVYCTVCGARNKAGSRFCRQDGSPIPDIDPRHLMPGFVPAAETYSSATIQRTIERASRSVVRIHARTMETVYLPVAEISKRPGRSSGHIELIDIGSEAAGSGFVISDRGEVVTNAHVAAPYGARAKLTIETIDGKTHGARLVGIDVASDLALLKIDTHSIPPLTMADERRLHLGEETWAVGNPLDIGISVTRGTISSIGRMRMGMNQVESYIHSDAYITSGNSGGPLLNVLGEVVGVSDLAVSAEKGQGYSIPSSMARLVIEQLREEGIYRRGFLGLHVSAIGPQAIKEFSLHRTQGLVVESVLKNSPADAAGFRRGDVIFGIDDRFAPVTYLMQEAVSLKGPGTPVRIARDRGGEVQDVLMKTALRPRPARIDPVLHFGMMLGGRFEQASDGEGIIYRAPDRFSIGQHFGMFNGVRIQKVHPAQDWERGEPEERSRKKKRSSTREVPGIDVFTLDDLRAALERAYFGGQMAATFYVGNERPVAVTVGFSEDFPAIF
jgi:S1-C subfamily serine protease